MSDSVNIPVPSPDHVRELLSKNLHERNLLRRLLKVSEKTAEVRRAFQTDRTIGSANVRGGTSSQ
jgi:hypothetical protein